MNYKGIAYPVQLGQKGIFRVDSDVALIESNIIQILGTHKGERVMLPEFGSNIRKFIHEPLDHITCALLRVEIFDAIKRWEPRIILDTANSKITAYPEEFRVKVELHYKFKGHGAKQNLILEINREEEISAWQD